jgi:hypothetical protein
LFLQEGTRAESFQMAKEPTFRAEIACRRRMPMRRSHGGALSLAGLLFPLAAGAQTLGGVAVDVGNHPVSGAVVMLLDSTSHVAARGLTNERGEFRLTAAHPGTYRVRTLRIGFRPTLSEPHILATGNEVDTRVVLAGIPILLDTVHATSRNVCRAFTDSGAATYAVWEQVRAALTAADLTARTRSVLATTVSYEQTLDEASGRVATQSSHVSTGYTTRPWRELPPDSLRRSGYVVAQPDNVDAYYAPGLDMLLSDGFVEDHCFRLTTDHAASGFVGIAFEPTPDRKRVAEVRGTVWVDRVSAELRRLEFRYVNVPPERQHAGGEIEFTRLADGKWLISRWNIRMPVLEQDVRGSTGGFRSETRVTAIQIAGGELALALHGTDTLWTRPPLTVAGSVRDSVSGAPVARAHVALEGTNIESVSDANGRFTMHGALPGEYTAVVHTPSLDSVNTAHTVPVTIIDGRAPIDFRVPSAQQFVAAVCGPTASRASTLGVVVGNARHRNDSATHGALRGLRVVAEWNVDTSGAGSLHQLEARGATDGSFRVCGVPLNVTVALRATAEGTETPHSRLVRLSSAVRVARADLLLERTQDLAARGATFIGVVVADSTHAPVAGADVSLPELGKSALTDSSGTFRIAGIPAGEHRVSIRRMGYGAADTRLAFTGYETVERRVVLGRAVILEPVAVTARATERTMPGFEDNRRVGLGHFLTRAELEKYTGMKLVTALEQLSDLATLRGPGGELWVTSRRAPPAVCPPKDSRCLESHGIYVPDPKELARGAQIACYAHVYLDGTLMNGVAEPTEPFDLSTVVPESVEAIEYYAGPSQTPLKYSRMGSNCGVLVIWTRRGL